MLKEALQYLIRLGNVDVLEHGGNAYSTQMVHRLDKESEVDALELQSLDGLIDYIKSNFDHDKKLMVHVKSPTQVSVYDALNKDNDRRCYVKSKALLPNIGFDRFHEQEKFNIMLQSSFVETKGRNELLKVIGSIVEDESVTSSDNGVSQRVVAKTGVATVGNIELPNPVVLKPFRSFVEIEQPESEYVLRLRKGPEAALFEADGAAWMIDAMASIHEYLAKSLADEIVSGKIVIIA